MIERTCGWYTCTQNPETKTTNHANRRESFFVAWRLDVRKMVKITQSPKP
ncbi:MAG: hypothetical protein [Olavius algarvensis Gamma 1 endosymbiont]|nr:MAG: hypothetical protein [Olavius algarvensis Gamma 1 endosymbiont]